jgi:hypothetical protein
VQLQIIVVDHSLRVGGRLLSRSGCHRGALIGRRRALGESAERTRHAKQTANHSRYSQAETQATHKNP